MDFPNAANLTLGTVTEQPRPATWRFERKRSRSADNPLPSLVEQWRHCIQSVTATPEGGESLPHTFLSPGSSHPRALTRFYGYANETTAPGRSGIATALFVLAYH